MDQKLVFCVVLRMKLHMKRQWILRFIGTKIYRSFTNTTVGQKVTSQCINVYFSFFPVDPNKNISALTALTVHQSSICYLYNWSTYHIIERALILSVYRTLHSVLSAVMSKHPPNTRLSVNLLPSRFFVNIGNTWLSPSEKFPWKIEINVGTIVKNYSTCNIIVWPSFVV